MSIQIKRGMKKDLPQLKDGELAFCRDTKELYVGNNGNENVGVTKKIEDRLEAVSSQLESIESKIKKVDVVIDLGCDNKGNIDCTSKIQDCINENIDNGVVLYFPNGEYIHKGLSLCSRISIEGENAQKTILKNVSKYKNSIDILGEGYHWCEEYFIKNITITSDKIEDDNRKGINNYINRNFIYDNVKIRNHKYGLYEKGSWYSQHIMLDIQDCEYGIYIPYYSIPGTPNSFENCIIRACDYNVFIGAGSDVLNFNGGHIGGANINQVIIDNFDAGNSRNIRFESVNFEGGLGVTDIVIGNDNNKGYIHTVVFDNCRFAQWETISNKIGIDIKSGSEFISLKDCYFIGYETCVKNSSDFFNKELLMLNCGKTNSTNLLEHKTNKLTDISPVCGVTKNKMFSIGDILKQSEDLNNLLIMNVGTQYKSCKKDNNTINISIRTNSENITSGTIIGKIDNSVTPNINIVTSCVGLNSSGTTVQGYGQVILKNNGDMQIVLDKECSYVSFNLSYSL